ncbi:hypothetical protein L3X38_023997 [Prunus dulcis]|uniref:Uncharacterized protein n=1 Tax=Prunus dulcis TaxID=3755 RepID=A0AAD4Z5R5_PRUDU|nr:hypothetical protein L3X38_023997 [Prunus dulcis]
MISTESLEEKVLEEKVFVDDFPYFSIVCVERFSWLLCSYQTHVQIKREYFEEKTERCCNKSHICFFGRSFYEMLVGENISFGHDCDMKPNPSQEVKLVTKKTAAGGFDVQADVFKGGSTSQSAGGLQSNW